MTEDITSLQIKVLYDSVTAAEKSLKKLTTESDKNKKATKEQEKANKSLGKSLVALAAAYVSVRTVVSTFKAIIKTTSEFQQLNAQLTTATGSAENAAIAFDAIKDFAQETPYDLQQATGAFISLVNRGLTPSERALRSYGDTASSMGFQLSDMVLAVSNATTGEFETLKRFGIKAKKEGENVKFTFRGVTEEVANNTEAIENYFINLGETEFAGGMERQMDTLQGAFSNFDDAWQVLLATIGESGLGDFVEDMVRQATEAIESFTAAIDSGQVEASISSWTTAFEGWGDDFSTTLEFVGELMGLSVEEMGEEAGGVWDKFVHALKMLPATIRYWIQRMGIEIGSIADKVAITAVLIVEEFIAAFKLAYENAIVYGEMIASALDPRNWVNDVDILGDAAYKLAKNQADSAKKIAQIERDALNEFDKNKRARIDALETIGRQLQDADDRVSGYEKKSKALREAYDAEAAAKKKAREESGEDRLKKFGVGAKGGSTSPKTKKPKRSRGSSRGGRGGKSEAERRREEFEALAQELAREERTIETSYKNRYALIVENTKAGTLAQVELLTTLNERYVDDQLQRIDAMKEEPETMFQAYAEERRILEENYALRRDIILTATETTEAEKQKLLAEAEQNHTALMRRSELERNSVTYGLAADFFGNISEMAAAFGKKGAKIAKAAAITQTIIKTYESATSAYASLAGIPVVGPALGIAASGAALAAGFANVQAIRSQSVGDFAQGGIVPGTSYNGDHLTANVNSDEMILNKGQQANLFRMANNPGVTSPQGGGNLNIIVKPTAGQTADVKQNPNDPQQVEIILRKVDEKLTSDLQTGDGQFLPALSARIPALRQA